MTSNRRRRIPLAQRQLPDYTRGEEIFNMVSHIAGGAMAIAALVLCVVVAAVHKSGWGVVSGAIYGACMLILYSMSSIYHGLTHVGAKKVFQVIDHCAIFLLIAGTYTPVTLCVLRPSEPVLAWSIFGAVWGVSALGIVLNAIDLKKYNVFSMICYLGLGWCIVVAIKPMIRLMEPGALWLMVAGGLSYTLGCIFYALGSRVRYMHSIFHLFVVAGSLLHFLCIVLYVM